MLLESFQLVWNVLATTHFLKERIEMTIQLIRQAIKIVTDSFEVMFTYKHAHILLRFADYTQICSKIILIVSTILIIKIYFYNTTYYTRIVLEICRSP